MLSENTVRYHAAFAFRKRAILSRLVPQNDIDRLHQELEKAARDLKQALDPDEKRMLLRKMRRLIDEADHLLKQPS